MNISVKTAPVEADRYELIREIGSGGSGVVYLVRDRETGGSYAMKILKKDTPLTETAILKALGRKGTGIPEYCGSIHGRPKWLSVECAGSSEESAGSSGQERESCTGFLMEYIEGSTLDEVLSSGRVFSVRETAEAGIRLCEILDQLHGMEPPAIYRDLKPANILIRKDGSYVIVDYGAVRMFREGALRDTRRLGTDGYAAPEQYGGWEQSDARTDIYGAGAVMHNMLTGKHPLDTGLRPVAEILSGLPGGEDRSLYIAMDKVLRRCCSVSPGMRFSSCGELEKALRGVLRACAKVEKEKADRKARSDLGAERAWKSSLRLLYLAAVFLFSAGMLSVSASDAEMARYHMFIEEGHLAKDLESRMESYESAVSLRPDDPEAYLAFLEEISADCVITQEEKENLEDLLCGQGNLEAMREKAPAKYAEFELEMGKAFFGSYEGGEETARRAVENARNTDVAFRGRKMAERLHAVLDRGGADAGIDAWRELQEEARREAENDGKWGFALKVSRAALSEIALRVQYDGQAEWGENSNEKVKEVIGEAEALVKEAEKGRFHAPAPLVEGLRTAVETADRRGGIGK